MAAEPVSKQSGEKNDECEKNDELVYASVRETLESARGRVERAVNSAMVEAYWEIGRQIVEATGGRAEYGKRLVEYLAECLTAEYGNQGSVRNLRYMAQFYRAFPIVNSLRSQLSWSHYRRLMRIPDAEQREFYMQPPPTGAGPSASSIARSRAPSERPRSAPC